jgi:proteasome lid subunit RPN8/RPN11
MIWQYSALIYAKAAAPKESCGLVVNYNDIELYWNCNNIADGLDCFVIDPADWADAEDTGVIMAIVHSHPGQSPEPSIMDRQSCERSQLPWHIVNPVDGKWSQCLPLIGREWEWAISDCWTLVRDWYALHGLLLHDWQRPSLEEFEADPLFDGLWESAGFYELADGALLQPGDALLMRIGDRQLNHVGVFIGDGMMLHHLRDQLSARAHCRPGVTGRRLRHANASTLVAGAGW